MGGVLVRARGKLASGLHDFPINKYCLYRCPILHAEPGFFRHSRRCIRYSGCLASAAYLSQQAEIRTIPWSSTKDCDCIKKYPFHCISVASRSKVASVSAV